MAQDPAETTDPADGEDAPKTRDVLAEAKERYRIASEYWSKNHTLWLDDAKFRNLDQWPDSIKERRGDERPCLVVDKCNQYVRQVVNDGRQNRPSVKVRPVDDNGDDEVAEAYQGIIRHICDRSNADEAFDTALDHAAGNGFGYFRVLTDYAHKGTFNHEIIIRRVRNPLAVLLDPSFQAADGSDAEWGFVVDELPKDKYKKQYPNAKKTNWDADAALYADGWISGENVRFVEYYCKVYEPRVMHLLDDGTTVSDDDYQAAVAKANGTPVPGIKDSRDIPECKVEWYRLSGAEILEDNDWQGAYIPLIPVFGNETDIAGNVTYSGLIRAAKDPQRLYNYMRSAFAERVALTPKAPFVAAEGQLEGHEQEWEEGNLGNKFVLTYKPTDVNGNPVAAPQRQPAADIPEGFARDMQLSEHDIQASMGMYNSSIGEKSNEKSGRAIMARQREGDTATFHYQDNLNRAIRYLGRILVDLIPKVYDSQRVVRILGEDGKAEPAQINPEQQEAVTRIGGQIIYNLGVGTYDVSVAAGPSYTTKRQEALEAGMQLAQANPGVWGLVGDVIVRNADWPGAEEISERLHAMLPPPILQAERAKKQGQDPKILAVVAPLQQQIKDAEQGIAQRDQALHEAAAKVQELESGRADEAAKRELDARKIDVEAYKAETERMQVLAPTIAPEQVQQIVQQTVSAIMAQPVPTDPPAQGAAPSMQPPIPPVMAPEEPDQPPPGGFFTPNA